MDRSSGEKNTTFTADTDYQQDVGILLNLLRRFFDAGPVNRNALGFVFPKVHVDADFVFFFLEIGTDMCLLLVEIYDILILCAFMGLGCRTQINCL